MRGYEGIGWYAVTLDGSWARAGQVQRLSFGRVMYHAKVWLNGELLGEHVDGYLPFTFDIHGQAQEFGKPPRAAGRQSASDRLACQRPSRSNGCSTEESCNPSASRAKR